jgi:FAD:protein FMN transferase
MLKLLLLFILSFVFALPAETDIKKFQISGYAQGTSYQLTYYATDSLISKKQIDSIFNKVDSSLSIYKSYSLISIFNRSQRQITADVHLKKVVKKALEIYQETDGAFDITVKPLVHAWGFGVKPVTEIPDSAKIKALLNCVGSPKIHFRQNVLVKERPCIEIDVNGIAQGYTVDLLAVFLESKKIAAYLVELGGEIRVKGRKPDNGLMTIGIESPAAEQDDLAPMQKVIQIEQGAVTSSGNYRKYRQSGNRRISHLIDPKKGYPIRNELVSVTVYAKDALTADGYDNALMGMGLQKALQFVRKQKNMEAYFIYQTKNGSVADTATAGFYKLIK